jgi:hypothetical protein
MPRSRHLLVLPVNTHWQELVVVLFVQLAHSAQLPQLLHVFLEHFRLAETLNMQIVPHVLPGHFVHPLIDCQSAVLLDSTH